MTNNKVAGPRQRMSMALNKGHGLRCTGLITSVAAAASTSRLRPCTPRRRQSTTKNHTKQAQQGFDNAVRFLTVNNEKEVTTLL